MGMLLVAAAAALLLISALQLPWIASSASIRPPPKIGSYASPARSQQLGKILKDFLRKHGSDVADVAQNLLPSPGDGGDSDRGQVDNAPAETTGGLYFANLLVGTPAQPIISVILDISTQLVWMQCGRCGPSCQPQPASYFSPTASHTHIPLSCDRDICQKWLRQDCRVDRNAVCGYVATYAGVSENSMSTEGYLAFDTFTFGDTPVAGMLFGCSGSTKGDYSGASGVIGFSRGPLSIVSQLGLTNFSYFLAPPEGDSASEIQLGVVDVPRTGRTRSTPLYSSPRYIDLYYVRLVGINVDGEEVGGIPPRTFDLRDDGSGGVFLSTTLPITYLLSDAYSVVRLAFASRISAQPLGLGSLDPLCYTAESMAGVQVPTLTLVFYGVDAAMELRTANYFSRFNDGERDLECLTVLPSQDASLLGTLLQTGTTMIYDLQGEKLMFVTAEDVASPSSSQPPLETSEAMLIAVTMLLLLLL